MDKNKPKETAPKKKQPKRDEVQAAFDVMQQVIKKSEMPTPKAK